MTTRTKKPSKTEETLNSINETLLATQQRLQYIESLLEINNNEPEVPHNPSSDDEHKQRMESSEPWVELLGTKHDPEKGVEIKLDWNAAFIKSLRDDGFTGDDDAMVQKWLALLTHSIIQKFEDKIIDNNTNKQSSDFV